MFLVIIVLDLYLYVVYNINIVVYINFLDIKRNFILVVNEYFYWIIM